MLIIVSRYNENIEWTKQFPNVLIYNKGDDLAEEYPCIKLPNVGREQHTYFKYIYDNYDNLEDYTVFLQGNPFDHTRDIVNKLHELINNKELDINFMNLSDWVVDCNLPHADIQENFLLCGMVICIMIKKHLTMLMLIFTRKYLTNQKIIYTLNLERERNL